MNVAMMFEEAAMEDTQTDLDPIQEMRLRTWARQNYVSEEERNREWHAVILDEMRQKDDELDLA